MSAVDTPCDGSPGSTARTSSNCPISGVAELTLEASDLGAAEHFYRRLLGLELLSRQDDRVWLAVGTRTRLGLWSPGRKEFGDRGGRHVHFALAAKPEELERLALRLRTAGVAVRGPIVHDGGDRSIYFEDPAGNVVEAWDFLERERGVEDGVRAL
ncbi:MAG: VOC family protein [Solirubrobacteraceae bacterium]